MTASPMPTVPDAKPPSGLFETVQQHFPSVYRLALASLDESKAARRAALATFTEYWLEKAQQEGTEGRHPLYPLALKHIHRMKRATPLAAVESAMGKPTPSWMVEPAIVQFNRAVDRLGKIEHDLLVLVYVLSWQPGHAGELLRVHKSTVQAQLNLFQNRLFPMLDKTPASMFLPADNLTELPDGLRTPANQRAAIVLQARWPPLELAEEDCEALTRQIEHLTEDLRQQKAKSRPYRGLTMALVAAAVLLLCLTGGLGVWLLNAQGMSPETHRSATATPYGSSTAFPQITKPAPLSRRSSDDEIRQRWAESPSLWHSLSVDAQTWRYGPLSYFGLPRSYRDQAWILQPDQSIVLNGLLGKPPGQSYLTAQDQVFWRSAAENESRSEVWDGSLEGLLPTEPLRSMIFPASSPWGSRPGEFRPVRTSSQAGREAVVFDWINPDGQREARLWLDNLTGIILRAQTFTGRDNQTLIDDSLVTSLVLDRSEPPPGLITGSRLGRAGPESSDPAFSALPPTPTPAAAPLDRPSQAIQPAPPGFNPAGSSLTFHFSRDADVANATKDTAAQPAELVADGYKLGSMQFGLPWALRCVRSPNGLRMAFNTGSDGATPADDSVRWFNMSKPQTNYQPLPDLEAVSFSFSPDNRRLAVAGQGKGYREDGVYLVDLGTGESSLLMAIDQAHSLAWSPDGEFLALIGIPEDQEAASILVLHVRTRQFAYQGPPGITDQVPADSPIASWGIPFPVVMGGMDECGKPPQP